MEFVGNQRVGTKKQPRGKYGVQPPLRTARACYSSPRGSLLCEVDASRQRSAYCVHLFPVWLRPDRKLLLLQSQPS